MRRLSAWLYARRSGKQALLWMAIACALPPTAFPPLVERFVAATGGLMPFDNQFVLGPASMHEQLARWSPEAFVVYRQFAAVDFVFPPLFGLGFAMTWAWLLGKLPAPRGEQLAAHGLLLVPLLSPVFDWLENLGNLLVIAAYPASTSAVWLALVGKYAKFGCLLASLCGALVLIGMVVLTRRTSKPPLSR